MREARIVGIVLAIDYRWLMGGASLKPLVKQLRNDDPAPMNE